MNSGLDRYRREIAIIRWNATVAGGICFTPEFLE